MQFSRTTTETFRADWIRRDFCTMTPEFRVIRAGARKKMTGCFKCRHKFQDGEMMALGSFGKRGNNVICQECAEYLLSLFGSAAKESVSTSVNDCEHAARVAADYQRDHEDNFRGD